MQSLEILDIVPEHVADPVRRAPWRKRLVTGMGDGILSLALNAAVVGWMMGVGWPLRELQTPQAISVELVDHMPGAGSGRSATPAQTPSQADGEGSSQPKVASAEPAPVEDAPANPDAPAPTTPSEPTPSEPPKAEPEPKVDAEAPASAVPSSEPPAPTEQSGASPPNPQPAVPPPPEHPDDTAAPHLVEAPSAPPPQPPQAESKPEPVAPPAPATEAKEAAPAIAEQPHELTSSESADAVPPPAPAEEPKPLTAEQKRQAENTAKLAVMMPFGASIGADPLQASLSSQGQGSSTAYRGAVYANFNKAQDVIEDAKAKHLKGQAVIAFTIDDHGGIASIGVAVSSRNPAVDQAALELIKRAAPFPPPPPGAQRSFAPAIGFGLDE